MVKPTKKIRRQIGDELFEYVWPFYGVGVERVKDARRENNSSAYEKYECGYLGIWYTNSNIYKRFLHSS